MKCYKYIFPVLINCIRTERCVIMTHVIVTYTSQSHVGFYLFEQYLKLNLICFETGVARCTYALGGQLTARRPVADKDFVPFFKNRTHWPLVEK